MIHKWKLSTLALTVWIFYLQWTLWVIVKQTTATVYGIIPHLSLQGQWTYPRFVLDIFQKGLARMLTVADNVLFPGQNSCIQVTYDVRRIQQQFVCVSVLQAPFLCWALSPRDLDILPAYLYMLWNSRLFVIKLHLNRGEDSWSSFDQVLFYYYYYYFLSTFFFSSPYLKN